MSDKPENLKCPDCGAGMKRRENKKTGQAFWGCNQFPKCKGTRDVDGLSKADKRTDDYDDDRPY